MTISCQIGELFVPGEKANGTKGHCLQLRKLGALGFISNRVVSR